MPRHERTTKLTQNSILRTVLYNHSALAFLWLRSVFWSCIHVMMFVLIHTIFFHSFIHSFIRSVIHSYTLFLSFLVRSFIHSVKCSIIVQSRIHYLWIVWWMGLSQFKFMSLHQFHEWHRCMTGSWTKTATTLFISLICEVQILSVKW